MLPLDDDDDGDFGDMVMLSTYLLFVTDTTDGVCVKKIARCKCLQI